MTTLGTGTRVGPWVLRKFLGSGGNADVWEAERDQDVVALKVLRTRNVSSEPFQRFRIETEFLQSRRPVGVIPVLESFLPATLKRGEKAWVAMPVANPIRHALGGAPSLEEVCAAIQEIATTMARLAAINVSHRDIKPGNLYQYKAEFLIGDFGLVSYPGKPDLTVSQTDLGPRNYVAPEMVANAATADGLPADVYSLAKTLWALAVGRSAPPPGELRRNSELLRLSAFVVHPRSYVIDELLETATNVDPRERPTMAELAGGLEAFLSGSPAGPGDVREAASRVAGAVARIEAALESNADPANRLVLYELDDVLRPVARALLEAGFKDVKWVRNDDILDYEGRPDTLEAEGHDPAWTGGRALETTVKVYDNFPVFRMLSGIALEVDRGDDLAIMVAAHARNEGTAADEDDRWIRGSLYWVSTRRFHLHVDEARRRATEELAYELLDNLRFSLNRFAADIEGWTFDAERARQFDW